MAKLLKVSTPPTTAINCKLLNVAGNRQYPAIVLVLLKAIKQINNPPKYQYQGTKP